MARRATRFVPGGYYHLYNRGAWRRPLFFEDENYIFVLQRLKQYVRRYHVAPIAYCLMPNHYHLLLRQDGSTRASLAVQHTFIGDIPAYRALVADYLQPDSAP